MSVDNLLVQLYLIKGTPLLFIIFSSNLKLQDKIHGIFVDATLWQLDLKIWPHTYSKPHVY